MQTFRKLEWISFKSSYFKYKWKIRKFKWFVAFQTNYCKASLFLLFLNISFNDCYSGYYKVIIQKIFLNFYVVIHIICSRCASTFIISIIVNNYISNLNLWFLLVVFNQINFQKETLNSISIVYKGILEIYFSTTTELPVLYNHFSIKISIVFPLFT